MRAGHMMGGGERIPRGRRHAEPPAAADPQKSDQAKKKKFTPDAWQEARALIWEHRKRLAVGLGLMLVNRLAGLVAPWSTKWLMDEVVAKGRWDLLPQIAMAVGGATLVESAASF